MASILTPKALVKYGSSTCEWSWDEPRDIIFAGTFRNSWDAEKAKFPLNGNDGIVSCRSTKMGRAGNACTNDMRLVFFTACT